MIRYGNRDRGVSIIFLHGNMAAPLPNGLEAMPRREAITPLPERGRSLPNGDLNDGAFTA